MRGSRLLSVCLPCLLLVALVSSFAFSQEFDALKIGAPAPEFTLRDLTEKEYTLSGLKGETVVVQFGSSTTVLFLEQVKPMNELVRKYRGKRVRFFTVYTREHGFDWQPQDYFSKYERAKGLRYQFSVQSGQRIDSPLLVDDMDESVYKAYGSVPAGVFIVDKDGSLAFKSRVVKAIDVDAALQKIM